MEYHDELVRIAEAGTAMDHDDPAAADAQARFRSLFDHFTPDALPGAVRETYSARPFFNDSLKTVRERETLAVYLAESATAVDKCTVDHRRVDAGAHRLVRALAHDHSLPPVQARHRYGVDRRQSTSSSTVTGAWPCTRISGMPPAACTSTCRCWAG
ncbi:MAG: hypothetical protein U5K33_09695 [Halofilum sp. (in: g-proteobacteria)]|nr:hypothetical protein [Halofilum sp. (in: g-proteobacteria)]